MPMTRLRQIAFDPDEAWLPWRPTANDPWGSKWAAHLYRRATFGPSPEEIEEAKRIGVQGTLDLLLQGKPDQEDWRKTLDDVGRVAAEMDEDGGDLRGWWVYTMLESAHPLREKLTLFWHGHFATSLVKLRSPPLMFEQNRLLREHALGRFGPMLHAISRDAAMMIWLDSSSNVKGSPNENYARELMELFSLGVGHYGEHDVREAARAFTGWRPDSSGRFAFDPRLHDDGTKKVLGQAGRWDGDDVVNLVLDQPATARFLVRKLYRFFINEQVEPTDALLEPLCESFRRGGYDISGLVRTMLASRLFYSDHAFRQRIKGPVEYALGALRALYRKESEGDADFRPLAHHDLAARIGAMGQVLFAPPNVKGWPGGPSWLNTSTLLERSNFTEALVTGRFAHPLGAAASESSTPSDRPVENAKPAHAFDPARMLGELKRQSPEEIVTGLLDLYLPGGTRPSARDKLVEYLAEGAPNGPELAQRVREAVHAILNLAEYQLA